MSSDTPKQVSRWIDNQEVVDAVDYRAIEQQLSEAWRQLDDKSKEYSRRIFYQGLVYEACNAIDHSNGCRPGTGIVCGNADHPHSGFIQAVNQLITARNTALARADAAERQLDDLAFCFVADEELAEFRTAPAVQITKDGQKRITWEELAEHHAQKRDAAEARVKELEQTERVAQVCYDMHERLGIQWGDDPYARIAELERDKERQPIEVRLCCHAAMPEGEFWNCTAKGMRTGTGDTEDEALGAFARLNGLTKSAAITKGEKA